VTIYRSAAVSGKQFGGGQLGAANGAVREIIDPGSPGIIGSLFEDQRGRIWTTSRDERQAKYRLRKQGCTTWISSHLDRTVDVPWESACRK